jgi:2-keto-4-pentenoate hydratase/2-oxohepta-3-ene-1,7-dioic acid hydratase in catechol pathway
MKIARCSRGGVLRWAVVTAEQGTVQPFTGALAEWAPGILAGQGSSALPFTGESWPITDVRLLPPTERGATIYVAGANYTKHLKEFRIEPPKAPFAFLKPYRALTGAHDDIPYSALTQQLDFEVELVAVVGAPLEERANALECVLGYTVGNDISARDLQKGPGGAIGMDFLSGKGLDHATPLGPWIVTRDEFGGDTPDLSLTLQVNGELRQNGRTSEMRWNVAELLSYVNARSVLEAGDVLFTGTPAGVAQGDGRFLKPGDVVEASIERVGSLRNIVVGNAQR